MKERQHYVDAINSISRASKYILFEGNADEVKDIFIELLSRVRSTLLEKHVIDLIMTHDLYDGFNETLIEDLSLYQQHMYNLYPIIIYIRLSKQIFSFLLVIKWSVQFCDLESLLPEQKKKLLQLKTSIDHVL
jgi:hypothetical protein